MDRLPNPFRKDKFNWQTNRYESTIDRIGNKVKDAIMHNRLVQAGLAVTMIGAIGAKFYSETHPPLTSNEPDTSHVIDTDQEVLPKETNSPHEVITWYDPLIKFLTDIKANASEKVGEIVDNVQEGADDHGGDSTTIDSESPNSLEPSLPSVEQESSVATPTSAPTETPPQPTSTTAPSLEDQLETIKQEEAEWAANQEAEHSQRWEVYKKHIAEKGYLTDEDAFKQLQLAQRNLSKYYDLGNIDYDNIITPVSIGGENSNTLGEGAVFKNIRLSVNRSNRDVFIVIATDEYGNTFRLPANSNSLLMPELQDGSSTPIDLFNGDPGDYFLSVSVSSNKDSLTFGFMPADILPPYHALSIVNGNQLSGVYSP